MTAQDCMSCHAESAGPATPVGISMGAGVAIETAVEHPRLVEALVVSGVTTTPPTFTDPWALGSVPRRQRAVADADAVAWLRATLDYAAGPHRSPADMNPDDVERVPAMERGFLAHVRPGVVPPQPMPYAWGRLNDIEVPALTVTGALDSPDHHRMTDQVADRAAGTTLSVMLPEADHLANRDDPASWRSHVEPFLRRGGSTA